MSLLVTFKRVYTTQTFEFPINLNWTIRTFLLNSKIYLSEQTQINFNNIEIVEAGLREKEQAKELDLYENLDWDIKKKFNYNYIPSFYLRVKNIPIPMSIHECPVCLVKLCFTSDLAHQRYLRQADGYADHILTSSRVCLINNNQITTLRCNHHVCSPCFNMMLFHRLNSCPLCRANI